VPGGGGEGGSSMRSSARARLFLFNKACIHTKHEICFQFSVDMDASLSAL